MDKERDPRTENEDLDQINEERISGAADEEEFENDDEIDEIEEEDEDVES
jgi:hypothetical protein